MTCAGRAVAAVEGRGRRHGDGRDAAALGQVLEAAAVAQAPPASADAVTESRGHSHLLTLFAVKFR